MTRIKRHSGEEMHMLGVGINHTHEVTSMSMILILSDFYLSTAFNIVDVDLHTIHYYPIVRYYLNYFK